MTDPAISSPPPPTASPWHTPAAARRKSLRERWRKQKSGQRTALLKQMAKLPPDAHLHTLINSQAFDDLVHAYETTNARAQTCQNIYKRAGLAALALATLATLAAALTLLPVSDLIGANTTRVVSGLQVAANTLSLAIVWWLNRTSAVDAWMSARAAAEGLRGELFAHLFEAPHPNGADHARLWCDKLALFRGAHVDYQRGYFASAHERHTKRARNLSLPRGLAIGATALAIAIAAITAFDWWPRDFTNQVPWLRLLEEPIRWELGLNTIASSLLAFASAHAMINQDERNAALYHRSGTRLDDLNARAWADVEAAAARGDSEKVKAYARDVQAILEADHQAWLLNRPPSDPTSPLPPRMKL